jgi:hypothetical protein
MKLIGSIFRNKAFWQEFNVSRFGVRWHLSFMINIWKQHLVQNSLCILTIRISSCLVSISSTYTRAEEIKSSYSQTTYTLSNSTLKNLRSLSYTERLLTRKEWEYCTISSILTKSILYSFQLLVMPPLTCQEPMSLSKFHLISVPEDRKLNV